jgi:multidrug resistance efflux pump
MARPLRLSETARRAGPVATLVVTLGLAAGLRGSARETTRVVGFAEEATWSVASTEMGRVATLAVEAGDPVVAGQVIATLDGSALDAEIAVAEAQKARLDAIAPIKEAASVERIDQEIAKLERELLDDEEAYARARSEIEALEGERGRAKKAVESKLATADELGRLDAQYAATKPLIEQKPRQIALLKTQLEAARARRKDIEEARAAGGTTSVGGDLLVAVARLEKLRRQRAEMTVRAPVTGRVAAVLKRPGEVLPAGQPIATVVGTRGRIDACVPKEQAMLVAVGQPARLHARGVDGPLAVGKTVAVAPTVGELPLRCRKYPTRPAWGRMVTIALDVPGEVVAGQPFDVEIDLSRVGHAIVPVGISVVGTASAATSDPPLAASAPSAAPTAEPFSGPREPVAMRVPESLRDASRFEPSGVLWRRDLGRYVIVSDDTGQKNVHDRAPWLFTMDTRGNVDPDPIAIDGIGEVDDLESIAAGASGEIFVLASQSHSKKGRRPASRTAFLKLSAQGSKLRAEGEVHLAELIEAAGSEVAARLGLPSNAQDLEIEAMTFHDGALFLGLKGPLDADGRALIWKLAEPGALFEKKTLDAAGLALWGRVTLDADIDGKSVPGGISELLFLPDGSLAIASTSSREEGTVESGRLWRVAEPAAGTLTARVVRTFHGQKPEGLSLSAAPGRVVVVFDAGRATPSWMELPWPP